MVAAIYKVRARKGCRPGWALQFHGRPTIASDACPALVLGPGMGETAGRFRARIRRMFSRLAVA